MRVQFSLLSSLYAYMICICWLCVAQEMSFLKIEFNKSPISVLSSLYAYMICICWLCVAQGSAKHIFNFRTNLFRKIKILGTLFNTYFIFQI